MNTAAGNHKISIPGMIYISHAGGMPYKLRRIMNEESGLNKKKQAAIEVVRECFWGDYLSRDQILYGINFRNYAGSQDNYGRAKLPIS